MDTIDILTVTDPKKFPDNNCTLKTPFDQIPVINNLSDVWMLAESAFVRSGQGTWNLSINAKPGDIIRWWDTTVVQETGEDLILVGFLPGNASLWSKCFEPYEAKTDPTGWGYIISGFKPGDISNVQFGMVSFQQNYISAKVKSNAEKGIDIMYYIVLAKLDVSRVAAPTLKALWRIDPHITIV
jgi:hypothetical protein